MDTLEDRLREELRSPRYELPLESDRLLAGISWRSRRRTSMTVGAAALTVLLALGGAVVVRAGQSRLPTDHRLAGAVEASRSAVDVEFLDENRGYAVVLDCTAGLSKAQSRCHYELGSSVDGGQRWTYRAVPTARFSRASINNSVRLEAFKTGQLVLDYIGAGFEADSEAATRRWASADGGRSWQQRSVVPTGQVDTVPPGAKVLVGCDNPTRCVRVLLVLRPDGTMSRLGSAVPHGLEAGDFADGTVPSTMASDGSVWLSSAGSPAWVAVSRDRGRSWRRSELPISAFPVYLSTSAGSTTYVWTQDSLAVEHRAGLHHTNEVRLYRTTDDGRTWTKITLPGGDNVGDNVDVSAVARPDGGALLFDDSSDRLYEIGPRGAKFDRITGFRASQLAGALTANTLRDAGGRYLLDGYGDDVGNVLLTSADGHSWRRLSLD
jgi:hypothetical protein